MSEIMQNKVTLSGRMGGEPKLSHSIHGEDFFQFMIHTRRTSDYIDEIPITVSGHLLESDRQYEGLYVCINGQVRTYNQNCNGKNKLLITIFTKNLWLNEEDKRDDNRVELEGFLCKKPIYRVSPLGREIADLMIAVNRMYGKSDYIPCIAWGRNAKYADSMEVGRKVVITGRIQSREYKKKDENGEMLPGIAREISVATLGDAHKI